MTDVWHRFVGRSELGHFRPLDVRRMYEVLREFDGQMVEVAVHKHRPKRTLPQNSKLHVLVHLIAKHTGENEVRIKRMATLEALGIEAGTTRETILGREIYEVRHTSDLSKDELSQVIDRLLQHCRFLELMPPADEDVEVLA